jgi:hypothetical protein
MSASQGRLRSAIQRIAREDPEIRGTIDAFKDRGGFDSVSIQVAGADDDRRICCDGSSSRNPNPGSETRDPDANAKDGLNPDNPADISDNLSGVVDCATGQPICFEGSDWIPPEGWEDAQRPPIDPTYVEGQYWRLSIEGSVTLVQTCGQARAAAIAYLGACEFNTAQPDCPNTIGVAFSIHRELCPGGGTTTSPRACADDFDPICDEPPPLADAWPSDDCINLAVKGGKFVASKYDPDVSSGNGWLKGKEEVELCDEFGNSFTVRASGSLPGGWKTISAQNPGDGYLYNAKGEQIARISESEYSDPNV